MYYLSLLNFRVFLKYINEAKEKIKRGDYNDKAEHELSVFQKLLKIDDNIAFTMTLDFLFAGIETVKFLQIIFPLILHSFVYILDRKNVRFDFIFLS